jgi:Uma2 family endonuclease
MKEVERVDSHYTYADYITWDDDVRYELVDGVAYAMTAPNLDHQSISGELHIQLGNFLKGKKCKLFASPVDVRLEADKDDDVIFQPDLIVVCDRSKIADGKSCKGAPDVVIEITSHSTARHDKILKFNRYLDAKVKEYWIIDPDTKTVNVFVLKKGEYVSYAYGDTDILESHVLEGCKIKLSDVFAAMEI